MEGSSLGSWLLAPPTLSQGAAGFETGVLQTGSAVAVTLTPALGATAPSVGTAFRVPFLTLTCFTSQFETSSSFNRSSFSWHSKPSSLRL